jgi:hypothetical protein
MKRLLLAALLSAMTLAAGQRVFEMRTYYTKEGRLPALLERFRNHTVALFEKHGMKNVGYWVPQDKPNMLVYILAHESKEAAKKSFDEFRQDPAWVKAKAESEASGAIVEKVESVFMDATDFSAIK